MIVIDANIFLRYLGPLVTSNDFEFNRIAAELFDQAKTQSDVFTCDGSVIAEVVFIMVAPLHYGMSRKDVVRKLDPLLRLPGCEVLNREVLVSALEHWELFPGISFVDAVGLSRALSARLPLLTFDKRLARVHRMLTERSARKPLSEGSAK